MAYFERREPEPSAVHVELIAAWFKMFVPAVLMSGVFLAVGIFCASQVGGALSWVAVATGTIASACRLGVIVAYRRQSEAERAEHDLSTAWQFKLGLPTLLFAGSLSLLGMTCFMGPQPVPQMLVTGILYGFCSGTVARGYVRPRICVASVALATVPMALIAASVGGIGYLLVAVLFLAFLARSFETIRFSYWQTREQIALRNAMTLVARHDTLTGLANRFGLREAYSVVLGSKREASMIAVHCLDLDRFKPVNDRFGHPVGDALLRKIAARITSTVRDGDIAARVGGDEFVVVQVGLHRAEEAEMFARRLARVISAGYVIDDEPIEIGVSLGYATSPPFAMSLDMLIEVADMTLYRVKRGGGGVGSSPVERSSTSPKAMGR